MVRFVFSLSYRYSAQGDRDVTSRRPPPFLAATAIKYNVGCSGWNDSGQPFPMFVLLSILYFSNRASPLPLPVDISNAPTGVQLPTCTCIHQRSITDILWSCFATLFVCTWVSVHPNIPGPDEGFWKVALRRLELMLWALICPELIIGWAFRQWLAARWLRDQYGGALFPS